MGTFDTLPPPALPEAVPATEPPRQPGRGAVGRPLALGWSFRGPGTLLVLDGLVAYPDCLEFAVRSWRVESTRPFDFSHESVRVGVAFSDGRACASGIHEKAEGMPALAYAGRQNHRRYAETDYRVSPLPPPGPLTLYVVWPDGGIPETAVELDAAAVLDAAANAEAVWT